MSSSVHRSQEELKGCWVYSNILKQQIFIVIEDEEKVYENPAYQQKNNQHQNVVEHCPQKQLLELPTNQPERQIRTISREKPSNRNSQQQQQQPRRPAAAPARNLRNQLSQMKTQTQPNRPKIREYVLNRDAVMRSGPQFDSPVVANLPQGSTILINTKTYSKTVIVQHNGEERKRILVKVKTKTVYGYVEERMGWISTKTSKGPMCSPKYQTQV